MSSTAPSRDELLAHIQTLLESLPEFSEKKEQRQLIGDALSFSGADTSDREGVKLMYPKRMRPWDISNMVKPKQHNTVPKLSVRMSEAEPVNELVEGENLSAMVTLYKYRGQVDLILTDPPYNTGKDFRYNDKWDSNPDDPNLGDLVKEDDGSRHAKWLRFMAPRLWMMREMLRPKGVIAICIDHRELYRLGCLMDDIFGEDNRIGIINWQKSYSPKSDSSHLSSGTEYVLVYAKDVGKAKTGLESRTEKMDSIYKNPDNDPEGRWYGDNITAASGDEKSAYGIQSPFTGKIHYPGSNFWRISKSRMKEALEAWGSAYEEKYIDDGLTITSKDGKVTKVKALVIKGCAFKNGQPVTNQACVEASSLAARHIYGTTVWPEVVFTKEGAGGPQLKRHLKQVKQGRIPMTYWAADQYETPLDLGTESWGYEESGASRHGINELDAVVGKNHGFETVKPLKLMKKIIQLWCPPDGIVVDPFAGSGSTGHAVLELNKEAGTTRRFVLMEQGNGENGDLYAQTLTAERLRRVVTGDWASGKRDGTGQGFRYLRLSKHVSAAAIRALEREEMADLLVVSYWNHSERARTSLSRVAPGSQKHLFAKNGKNEGFFLVWDGSGDSAVTRDVYEEILDEMDAYGLTGKAHVYAGTCPFFGPSIEFYQIPDKVLEYLNFDARRDAFEAEEIA